MSAIFISEFSSLNFRKDWKLSFQQNVDYIPKFLPTDNIQVQYVVKDFTLNPYLKNICTGEVKQLSPVLLLENESEKCYQLTINNSSISSDTEFNLYFASDQDGEKIKDANFCVCTELPDTILLEYTNRKNVYETIFDGIDRFLFRVEGAFLPQEISFENNTEEFRDQRYVSKILSSTAFEKKTLTLGGGMGVPNWVARKINLIFSLSSVHVEGTPMVRSDGGAVELTEIGKYYPLYIYKIVLEDGEDNEDTGDGIIEYLRAVDEKKKIIRKSSENDLRVYLEGTGIDTAKMIRELELIGELSMNYTIEIDDNLSGSTNKTTLQSLIQFISKDFVTNNKFKEYIDQPVRTTDDVKFNSVVAKESIKTGKVTAEEVVSENFTSGLLGVGHRLWNGVLEISELIVRKTMHVFEIIVQKVTSVNGSMLTTPGGGVRISEVEELEDGYKCLFNNDDGTIPNPFIVGDQALHQVFTGKNIGRYWRLVTEVGDNYFVLSKTDCEAGSGIPQVEDEIIQFGNRTDKNRQNAVLTTSYGSDAPYTAYYSNVNSYSLEGKEDVREGNLRGINDPDFGQLQGSGFYGKNVYLKGIFRLLSGKTVEESIGDVQSNLDNLQVGGTNLLNGTTLDWVDATNASPLYYVDSVYLPQLRGKQITYSGLIKGINAQADTIGLETEITYTDESRVYENIFFGNRGNFEIQVQEHILILDKEIRNIKTYPIFRNGTVSGTIKVKQIQVEIGNKATTWKPSINDQKEIAKQQGIAGGQEAVDKVQIGSQNLISWKMMLEWNKKNKDIAVYGMDGDGVYLTWNLNLMNANGIAQEANAGVFNDFLGGTIAYKPNTQYVLSIQSKSDEYGARMRFYYTDGVWETKELSTAFGRIDFISKEGKSLQKIAIYIARYNNPKIYNISLIEGNKPLQGFPVATDDLPNNINLADGTKEVITDKGSSNNSYATMYMPQIKPNTIYYVNAQKIEVLSGNATKFDFILFDKSIKSHLTTTYHHLYDKNGGIIITRNDFEAQEGYLLCYAGEAAHTAGNSVRFTEVMLVEGFLPAPVWTPSFSEQQAEIKTITKTITEIKAENGEISLRVNEVSDRVEEAKQEAIDTAKEYTTLKTYRETDIDLRAEKWDQDTYYPVTIKLPINDTRIEVTTELGDAKPKWSTHEYGFSMNCVWRSNRSGWGANVVNRIIEVFEYRFTKEIPDTTPVQYILPAGSIGQLISSSEELIYLRGGGRYLFKIGNNCVAVVHDSRYTAPDGSSVAPAASVIRPVLTNVMKTEFDSQITQLKNSINLRVTKTDYDKNNQDLNQSIGNLQTSYNSISGTVSSLNTRLQTVEKAGYITTSQGNTLYASKKLENGNELISYINQDATNTTIKAKNINLNGAISANGNVQITTDGKLIAVNGEFTGKITATEGEIAGLKLSNNGLRSSDFNASSKVGSCYAKNGFSVYASGSGVLAPSTGALQAGIITAIGTQASITGLEIIAKNTSSSATLSEITALKLRAIDYVDDSIKMAPTAALIVEEGVSIFRDAVEIAGKSTFRNKIYLNLASIPNISGASNYYLCINRSTGQLSYR